MEITQIFFGLALFLGVVLIIGFLLSFYFSKGITIHSCGGPLGDSFCDMCPNQLECSLDMKPAVSPPAADKSAAAQTAGEQSGKEL